MSKRRAPWFWNTTVFARVTWLSLAAVFAAFASRALGYWVWQWQNAKISRADARAATSGSLASRLSERGRTRRIRRRAGRRCRGLQRAGSCDLSRAIEIIIGLFGCG